MYVETKPNDFGLFRKYTTWPEVYTPPTIFDPDETMDVNDVFDATAPPNPKTNKLAAGLGLESDYQHTTGPFENDSILNLMTWFYSGSNLKSKQELSKLLDNVIRVPGFDPTDLDAETFNLDRETASLDNYNNPSQRLAGNGWNEATITIRLPCENVTIPEDSAHIFEIPGLHYRNLTDLIINAFQEDDSNSFHNVPFTEWWKPSDEEDPIRVYGEMYSSDAMLEAHDEVHQSIYDEPRPQIETVIAALMFWSDSTHLTSFGNASLWPIYLFFGNLSKYMRSMPSAFAAHHVAYIPSVSCFVTSFFL